MRAHRTPWSAYLAVGVLGTVGVLLLPTSPAQDLGYLAVSLSAPVAIVLGAWMHRPHAPAAWWLVVSPSGRSVAD